MADEGILRDYLSLFRSRTVRDSALLFFGNTLGAAIGFIISVLIARSLGPSELGFYTSVTVAFSIIISLSDLGVNTSVVRYATKFLQEGLPTKAYVVFYSALKFRVIVSLGLTVLGIVFVGTFADRLLDEPRLVPLLKLSLIGLTATAAASVFATILQAYKEFKKSIALAISGSILQLGYIAFLFYKDSLTVYNILLGTIAVMPFITLSLYYFFLPKRVFSVRSGDSEISKLLFHFGKWVTISSISVLLANNLDYYMLLWFKDAKAVGIYAAAWKLGYLFPIMAGAMSTALLPHVAPFETKDRMRQYLRKTLKVTFPIFLLIILGIFPARFLINFVFGPEYLPSISAFRVLLIAFSITVIVNPLGMVIYSLNKPSYFAFMNISQLLITIVGNIILIPKYGIVGPAISVLLTGIFGALFVGIVLLKIIYGSGSPEVYADEQV